MNIKIKKYVIQDENIPKELSGYRIALFSDSHDNDFGPGGEAIISRLDTMKPDVVLFAGDGNSTSYSDVDPSIGHDNYEELFKAVSSKYDTYYVAGNHEHRWERLCSSHGRDDYDESISRIKGYGVNYLDNKSVRIADGRINIVGLDLPREYYLFEYEKLTTQKINELVGAANKDCYNILLTHTPIFFEEYARWGANLSLCGHMHGGMIRLPLIGGVLSPYRKFFPKYDYGYFEKDGAKMIISSGAGDHNIRFSLINPYELVLITLEHKE